MIAEAGTRDELPAGTETELAAYRYHVFVEQLGWELPLAEAGYDRDQFDRADTRYALIRDDANAICGCARLLPTTRAYLLAEVFPELLDGQSPPCSAAVWELSRYTTELVDADRDTRQAAKERFRRLLREVVVTALAEGAERLITFSYVGVERIARRFGLHVHRAGAIHLVDERPVLAFWIELDAQTRAALGLSSSNDGRAEPVRPGMTQGLDAVAAVGGTSSAFTAFKSSMSSEPADCFSNS